MSSLMIWVNKTKQNKNQKTLDTSTTWLPKHYLNKDMSIDMISWQKGLFWGPKKSGEWETDNWEVLQMREV